MIVPLPRVLHTSAACRAPSGLRLPEAPLAAFALAPRRERTSPRAGAQPSPWETRIEYD